MNKKKSIVFLTNLILIIFAIMPVVNASVTDLISIGSITGTQLTRIKAVTIIGTIKWVGYLVGIGMFIWVGIKYLLAGAGEKAKAKETLIPLLAGAILITTGTAITATVFSIFGHGG